MKVYIFFFLSSISSVFNVSTMQIAHPLEQLSRVVGCLSYALKFDLEYCKQHTADSQILEAKKSLYTATTSTLDALKRLIPMATDPVTLSLVISGIVPTSIAYTATPEQVYRSHKARIRQCDDGKIEIEDHTGNYIEHMLNILKPYRR